MLRRPRKARASKHPATAPLILRCPAGASKDRGHPRSNIASHPSALAHRGSLALPPQGEGFRCAPHAEVTSQSEGLEASRHSPPHPEVPRRSLEGSRPPAHQPRIPPHPPSPFEGRFRSHLRVRASVVHHPHAEVTSQSEGLAASGHTPLCPAGHLPLKGGDQSSGTVLPTHRRSGRQCRKRPISPLEGEMSA